MSEQGRREWAALESIRLVKHVEARVRSIQGGPREALTVLSDAFSSAAASILARAAEVSPAYEDEVRSILAELVGEQYREVFRDADGVSRAPVRRVA
jgi:DNA-directed RNA polymerase subunit F